MAVPDLPVKDNALISASYGLNLVSYKQHRHVRTINGFTFIINKVEAT